MKLARLQQRIVHALLCVAALACVGCQTDPVADNVTLAQANEVVAFLSTHGVQTSLTKETGGRGRYSVSVPREEYPRAASLLHEKQIPQQSDTAFSELIEQRGLMPNSREIEALRLDRARSAELEELLSRLPAVSSVRVVVRSSFPLETTIPAVSVVIEERPEQSVARDEVTRIIANSIPGLVPEKIEIALKAAAPLNAPVSASMTSSVQLVPFLFDFKVRKGDYLGLMLSLLGCVLAAVVVAAFFGYRFGFYTHAEIVARREREHGAGPAILPDDVQEKNLLE